MYKQRIQREIESSTRSVPSAGFTLVEMLVSTGLFTIVILVVVGALISLEAASKKARTVRVAADNVSAAVDSMTRTIRMGTYFHCACPSGANDLDIPLDCPMDNTGTGVVGGGNGAHCLAIEGQNGDATNKNDQIVYRLSGNHIQRCTLACDTVGAQWVDMTAPEINITDLNFYVGGTTLDDNQGYVTILVRGIASTTKGNLNTPFDVQTTISQRTPNFDLVP